MAFGWVAVRCVPMGWTSVVGVVQHLHRRVLTRQTMVVCPKLDLDLEYRRASPSPRGKGSASLDWWSMYVHDFEHDRQDMVEPKHLDALHSFLCSRGQDSKYGLLHCLAGGGAI